jgi:5'-3' exonuclease
MRRAGIQPLVIFDGRTPVAKAAVVEERRIARAAAHEELAAVQEAAAAATTEADRITLELRAAELQAAAPVVTSGERDAVKQLLYAAGVLHVTARGEADDLLAYLARTAQIQAVVTTDMDFLARGLSVLVRPDTPDASVFTVIRLPALLERLGVSQREFVVACALMGSDYTVGGQRLRGDEAMAHARRGGVQLTPAIEAAIQQLEGGSVSGWADLLSESQQAKWSAGAPPVEPEGIQRMTAEYGWPRDWQALLTVNASRQNKMG